MILLNDIKSQSLPPRALTALKLLITGPVGVGKTTVAKALAARHMGVEGVLKTDAAGDPMGYTCDISQILPFDFFHVNGGDDGIDKIRDLAAASMQPPSDPRARRRAFIIDEIHALPDKAIQALLLPLERDMTNLWIACTSRPAGQLDAALRSRFSFHAMFGAADVAAVLTARGVGAPEAQRIAKASQGDMRLALGGGVAVEQDIGDVVDVTASSARFRGDARKLLALAIRNPHALQVAILDAVVMLPDVHTVMTATLSPRNDVAAHQLLAAARKARLL